MPNITMTPPPSTGRGVEAITAPNFGRKPQTTRMMAPIVTTWQLMIPVMPTVWLNNVLGRPSKTEATALPRLCSDPVPSGDLQDAGLIRSCARVASEQGAGGQFGGYFGDSGCLI